MLSKAKKEFGQNFLINISAITKLIDCAQIQKGERVLEIGPGMGAITQPLIDAGAQVTAVEIDKDLIEPLEDLFGDQIRLINEDVLRLPSSLLEQMVPYKVVSSIPYNITSDILKTFLTMNHAPERLCLVVQKEVAVRVSEQPPRMSLLSVVSQMYAECEKLATIKAGGFRPMPKVDSAILRLKRYPNGHPTLDGADPEKVIALARAGFASKRKQLHKNLSSLPRISSSDVQKALSLINLDPKVRAENLKIEDWIKLYKTINI